MLFAILLLHLQNSEDGFFFFYSYITAKNLCRKYRKKQFIEVMQTTSHRTTNSSACLTMKMNLNRIILKQDMLDANNRNSTLSRL